MTAGSPESFDPASVSHRQLMALEALQAHLAMALQARQAASRPQPE